MAIGGAVLGWMLAYFGYEEKNALDPTAVVVQSAETIKGIRYLISIIPAGMAILTFLGMLIYKLDEKTMYTIKEDLEKRREEED